MRIFPDNRPQKYQTKLYHPVQLQGHWEVALSEIQYPRTWDNLDSPLQFGVSMIENVNHARDFTYYTIDNGHYDGIRVSD